MGKELSDILGDSSETETPLKETDYSHSKFLISSIARSALAAGIQKEHAEKPHSTKEIFDEKRVSFKEIDSYNNVIIINASDHIRPIYNISLPKISLEEWGKIKKVKEDIINDPSIDFSHIKTIEEKKKALHEEVKSRIRLEDKFVEDEKLDEIAYFISKSTIGYGVLEFLLEDDNLEEIMLIGDERNAYVFHRKHGMCSTNLTFEEQEILEIINRIAEECGRKIDPLNPLLDARLRDGSRVNATLSQVTPGGATLTIRKFRADPLTIIDLIKIGTIPVNFAATLWLAVDGFGVKPANIIVSGGTGSGKTTTLNTLATFIPEGDRIVSIEDTLELQLSYHEHWVQMETIPAKRESLGKVDMKDCLINSLRMRPDRIIVGEVRGGEANTLFTAMNTGHDGCMGTIHANDSKETITRLTNPPMNVNTIMLPALDLIVIQNRLTHPKKGYVRRIVEVSEVAGMENDKVLTNKTFSYNITKDKLEETGTPSRWIQTLSKKTGVSGKVIGEKIDERGKVLKWLADTNQRSFNDVHKTVLLYHLDKDHLMKLINANEHLGRL